MRPPASRRRALRWVPWWLALLLLPWAGCQRAPRDPQQRGPLRVAAAADLQDAFGELAALYRQRHGREVALIFGASGILTRQVREGAPYDLLATASPRYIDELDRLGLLTTRSRLVFARGQLAIYGEQGQRGQGRAQAERPRGQPAALTALADLTAPWVRRIAVANPEHAPYGAAAVAALRGAGLYDALRERLVYAEDVRQALRFAETGAADAALVARSLCVARCAAVPADLHPPVDQALGILRGGDEAGAARFAALLRSAAGREALTRHGFQILSGPGGP